MIGLEYIMKLNKVSCTELSKNLGVTKQSVSKWVNGKTNISEKYLVVLTGIFNVDSDYLTKEINELDMMNIKSLNKEVKYTEADIEKLNIISKFRNNINDENANLYKKFLLLAEKIDNEPLEGMLDNLIKISSIK